MAAKGQTLLKVGGFLQTPGGFGHNVYGFAIDPETFENLATNRYGEHYICNTILSTRIIAIEALRKDAGWNGLPTEEERDIKGRIMHGFVFKDIEGFKTPLLIFSSDYCSSTEKRNAVINRIKAERKYIPITYDFRILDDMKASGNPTSPFNSI